MPRTSYALKTFGSSTKHDANAAAEAESRLCSDTRNVLETRDPRSSEGRSMRYIAAAALVAALAAAGAAQAAVPPQGTQSDTAFATSYQANGVTSNVPTELQMSCYAPEVTYFGALSAL